MAIQPSVAEYFNNRKRPANDDFTKVSILNPNKVMILDESSNTNKLVGQTKTESFVKKIIYTTKETNKTTPQNKKLLQAPSKSSSKCLSSVGKVKKGLKPDGYQMDIRKSLFKTTKRCSEKESDSVDSNILAQTERVVELQSVFEHESVCAKDTEANKPREVNVPFLIKGTLSPAKCAAVAGPPQDDNLEVEQCSNVPQSSHKTPDGSTSTCRKELNLGNLKAMVSRSSRLQDIKAALNRFNENKVKLKEIQAKAAETVHPVLQGNESIELDILPSPLKTPSKIGHAVSPQGKLTPSRLFATPPPPLSASPLKSPLKSPAFQRYQALVTEGRPALVLPFKYRALAELFRCVDTVTSMMHNRRETITLSKLRPGVQEISRKNLTEYQLGQIKTVFPNAFEFSVEKMRAFGSAEKYELVITPLMSDLSKDEEKTAGDHKMMGPNVLLARRRTLYHALLDLTKTHHEEFLASLDPPMSIPRSRLTRWHPEFNVDDVPDVISASLPQPPNVEKVTTAKDVLERARSLFVVNPRMERALQRVIENGAAPAVGKPSTPTTTPATNKPGLHGVPASLLERVRAKQAARALEAMTRTPAQAKEAVRLTRLPEIARIIRNLFVAEKKSVLTREVVLQKLGDSYRESLSLGELDDHLNLLSEKTPGWVTFCNLRKTDYVKLSRNADMSRVMSRLEELAIEKCV